MDESSTSTSNLVVTFRNKNDSCPHCVYHAKSKFDLVHHVKSQHYAIVRDSFLNKAEIGQLTCKYCFQNISDYEYKKHLLTKHLDIGGSLASNFFTCNPKYYQHKKEIPPIDDWIIDYSELTFHDPVFKNEWLGTYKSWFYNCENESNKLMDDDYKDFFKYSISKDYRVHTKFWWKCPLCDMKNSLEYFTFNMLVVGTCGHILIHHSNDFQLKRLAENELQFFNIFHKTNFKLPTSAVEGPLLLSDFVLGGKEAEFIVEELYPIENPLYLSDSDVVCRFCLLFFKTKENFILHVENCHSYANRQEIVYVQPHQIDPKLSRLFTENFDLFAFSREPDGNQMFYWKCHYCKIVIKHEVLFIFIVSMGAHILLESTSNRFQEFKTMLKKLTGSFSGKQWVVREALLENCRKTQRLMAKLFQKQLPPNKKRKCRFCWKDYELPETLNDEAALLIHLYQDHPNKDQDDQLVYFLTTFENRLLFPYLKVFFMDFEKECKKRKYECSLCGFKLNSLTALWNHALWHNGQILHDFNPDEHFLMLTGKDFNCLVKCIDAFPKQLMTPVDELLKVYVCINCNLRFYSSDQFMVVKMQTHLLFCNYPKVVDVICPLPKKTIHFHEKISSCKQCQKQYRDAKQAKFCCENGESLIWTDMTSCRKNKRRKVETVSFFDLIK